MKRNKRIIRVSIAAISVLIIFLVGYTSCCGKQMRDDRPSPCRLCGYPSENPPCVVDLSNAVVMPLRVFPPHERIANAIDERQELYHGSSTTFTGRIMVSAEPESRKSWAEISTVPEYDEPSLEEYFCSECISKIKMLDMQNGLVLCDLYDRDNVQIYPVTEGETYQIRHYTVEVGTINNNQSLKMDITSNYFEGGKALDKE